MVPDEQLGHEQDSAHVIGHIVPAFPCGNHCAVLCDVMPANDEFLHGLWLVTTFVSSIHLAFLFDMWKELLDEQSDLKKLLDTVEPPQSFQVSPNCA